MKSILQDRFEIAKSLMEKTADVCGLDKDGKTILHHLCLKSDDHVDLVKRALTASNGRAILNSLDNDGATPLYYAATHGRTNTVNYLLSLKDCDVNACAKDGTSPLMKSILHDRFEIAKSLMTGSLRRLRRIGRYLKKHPRLVWMFDMQDEQTEIVVMTDADWAGWRRCRRNYLHRRTLHKGVGQHSGSDCQKFSGFGTLRCSSWCV